MFREISVREAKTWLESEHPPRLIDCREPEEFGICQIAGAELIPFPHFAGDAKDRLADKQQPVLIYCHHGVRSAFAADWLDQMGYAEVASMAGGIQAWADEIDPAMARY